MTPPSVKPLKLPPPLSEPERLTTRLARSGPECFSPPARPKGGKQPQDWTNMPMEEELQSKYSRLRASTGFLVVQVQNTAKCRKDVPRPMQNTRASHWAWFEAKFACAEDE